MGLAIGVVLIIVIGTATGTVWYLISKVKRASREIFGTENIVEGLKQQEFLEMETPKTVSGMTRLELPRITKDFPEFNWSEWKQKSENILKAYLQAIEDQEPLTIDGAGRELKQQVKLLIDDAKNQGIRETFDNIKIHQTEITRYQKSMGICKIIYQTTLEYYHTLTGLKGKQEIDNKKEQHRFELELVYIQDISKIESDTNVLGNNCPNCGAPLNSLGEKHCPYCGTGLEPINIRTWELHKITDR